MINLKKIKTISKTLITTHLLINEAKYVYG